jgi:uncharacterized protein YggT (Ycf19 family)
MGDESFAALISLVPMFIFFLCALTVWTIILIALWRGVKAHESIAESLRRLAEKQ